MLLRIASVRDGAGAGAGSTAGLDADGTESDDGFRVVVVSSVSSSGASSIASAF